MNPSDPQPDSSAPSSAPSLVKAVCVYCSSSSRIDPAYSDLASELGALIAERIGTLVFGGNAVGLMKLVADAVHRGGGRVVGVTPQLMHDRGITHTLCDDLIVTPDLRTRKAEMQRLADAFITLPGGFGTLEELLEIITHRQLNYHDKPIVILNARGFFDPLIALFEHVYEHRFARPEYRALYHLADSPAAAIDLLTRPAAESPQAAAPPDKWS